MENWREAFQHHHHLYFQSLPVDSADMTYLLLWKTWDHSSSSKLMDLSSRTFGMLKKDYFEYSSNKMLAAKGGKLAKEWLTACLLCCAAEENFVPAVTGKACFQTLRIQQNEGVRQKSMDDRRFFMTTFFNSMPRWKDKIDKCCCFWTMHLHIVQSIQAM